MIPIIEVQRRSAVLNHPSLPCLGEHYTINLTAGCPHQCRYCYAQSLAHHPGWGQVLWYSNSLDLLSTELRRRRKPPRLVFFSTACEPFVPDECVLSMLYSAMELLLEHSVFLLISTKGRIPDDFLRLLARHSGLVHVQVGITTLDDSVCAAFEPNAPSVEERLSNLRSLLGSGINAEARMDPLIPELTDEDGSFRALCRRLAESGCRRVVASHLFLRQANLHMLNIRLGGWSFRQMARRLYTHEFDDFCGHGTIYLPSTDYRRDKLSQLKAVAADCGVALRLCRCTNPDVTSECCHPAPPDADAPPAQSFLFEP